MIRAEHVFLGQNAESLALVAALRETIQKQAEELDTLNAKLKGLSTQADEASDFIQQRSPS